MSHVTYAEDTAPEAYTIANTAAVAVSQRPILKTATVRILSFFFLLLIHLLLLLRSA